MAGGIAVDQLDMLQIKQAARQEKEKSSQTRGRGMRSYTLDIIETYVSVTNDNPAPPDFNVGKTQHGFWLRTFFQSNFPPLVKKIMLSCFEIPTLKSGVRGSCEFCRKRDMKVSCELFSTTSRSIHLSYNDTLQLARKSSRRQEDPYVLLVCKFCVSPSPVPHQGRFRNVIWLACSVAMTPS